MNSRLAKFASLRFRRGMKTSPDIPRLALLYQAIDPPVINGVKKPAKRGGYQDSGADIANCLRSSSSRVEVVTPKDTPDVSNHEGWSFPDTESGILAAIQKGATHLWANTVLFASHPLQTSDKVGRHASSIRLIGQPPLLVERYDDKTWINALLRKAGGFSVPRAWTLDERPDLESYVKSLELPFPVVGKPVRGRGSHGVKLCHGMEELVNHARSLFKESPSILVEEFLSGEEATVTVMPPTVENPNYQALPVVTRFNHQEGIAPYSGEVAVSANSRAVVGDEAADPTYVEAQRRCERVAALLGVTAPIRIDVRRFDDDSKSPFALFDINMKPNMTGPGRPGRDNQASLVLLAAQALGWDYGRLLETIVATSSPIEELRRRRIDF